MNKIITAFFLLITLTSCGGDKEYYTIPPGPGGKPVEHPGRITIPDNTSFPDGTTITVIDTDGNEVKMEPGQSIDVEAGQYKVVVTQNATGVTISSTIASLPTTPEGQVTIAPAFLADVVTVTVYEGKVTVPDIFLKPITREVQVKMNISGIAQGNITGVKATLYSVANSVDVAKGFGSVVAGGNYHVTASTEGYTPGTTINLRILGITGASQNMSIEVSTSGGAIHKLQQDVSKALAGFNSGNQEQPVLLNASLSIDTDLGIGGTIKPWKPGWEGEIEGY